VLKLDKKNLPILAGFFVRKIESTFALGKQISA